jgi:hypothetical protein
MRPVAESVEDLAAWLSAVWDEEERLATAATDGPWTAGEFCVWSEADVEDGVIVSDGPDGGGGASEENAAFIAANHPASVLARIAADRKILALHSGDNDEPCQSYAGNWAYEPCKTLRLLASPYADRPGFRSEWLVERQGVEQ